MANDIKTAFDTFDVMNYPTGGEVSVYTPSVETSKYNTVEQRSKPMSIGKAIYQIGGLTSSFISKTQTNIVLSPVGGVSFDGVIGNTRQFNTSNLTWSIILPYEFNGDVYLYLTLNSSGVLVTFYSYQSNADTGMESLLGLYVVTFALSVVTSIQNHSSYSITDDTFHPSVFQDPHDYFLEQEVVQVHKLSTSPNKNKHLCEYCGTFIATVTDGSQVDIPLPTIPDGGTRTIIYTELIPFGVGSIIYCSIIGGSLFEYTFHGADGEYTFSYLIKCHFDVEPQPIVYLWNGSVDGDLENPLNYTPNGIPSFLDSVTYNVGEYTNAFASGNLSCKEINGTETIAYNAFVGKTPYFVGTIAIENDIYIELGDFTGGATVFNGNIRNNAYLISGIYNGEVINGSSIFGGIFSGSVSSAGLIYGGTFNGNVTGEGSIIYDPYTTTVTPIFNGTVILPYLEIISANFNGNAIFVGDDGVFYGSASIYGFGAVLNGTFEGNLNNGGIITSCTIKGSGSLSGTNLADYVIFIPTGTVGSYVYPTNTCPITTADIYWLKADYDLDPTSIITTANYLGYPV